MKKLLFVAALLLPLLAQALPFVPTTSPSTKPIHWYYLKTGNMFIYASPDPTGMADSDIYASSTSSDSDNYLWCFVGTASTGYKIYNRGSKSYLYDGPYLGDASEPSVDYYEAGSGNNFYIYTNLQIIGGGSSLKNYLIYYNNEFYTTKNKANSYTVTEVFVEQQPVVTDPPTITLTTYENNCVITATGNGEVHLYINGGSEVENPYTVIRTNQDQTISFKATAQETGKEMNTTVSTFTIPRLENQDNPTAELTFSAYGFNVPHNYLDNYGNEGYAKLFDKKRGTKWCVVNTTGAWETIWVDFKSNVPFVPSSYTMTPGNDTYDYTTRNPKEWKIYGKTKENDNWSVLTHVTEEAAASLGTNNNTDYPFEFSGIKQKYQYFRFEVIQIKGREKGDSNNWVFQLAELQLVGTTAVDGDVNGDGEVSVADVTLLVDLLLNQMSNEFSDVNGDGETGVADLTALVGILMTNNK